MRGWVRWSLILAITADVLESAALMLAAISHANPVVTVFVAIFALVKWASFFLTLVLIVGVRVTRVNLTVMVRRLASALKVHRLALIFLLLLGVVALIPSGAIIFDQMPDVQRRWFAQLEGEGGHFSAAVVGVIVVAIAFWMLGRRRSERYFTTRWESDLPDATPDYQWFIAPALLLLFTIPVLALTSELSPLPRLLILLVLVPLAILLAVSAQKALERADASHDANRVRTVAWHLLIAAVAVAVGVIVAWFMLWLCGKSLVLTNFGAAGGIVLAGCVFVGASLIIEMTWRSVKSPSKKPVRAEAGAPKDDIVDLGNGTGDSALPLDYGPFLLLPFRLAKGEYLLRSVIVTRIGDLIAVLVICLAPLGILRSSVAPVFVASLVDSGAARDQLYDARCGCSVPWVP